MNDKQLDLHPHLIHVPKFYIHDTASRNVISVNVTVCSFIWGVHYDVGLFYVGKLHCLDYLLRKIFLERYVNRIDSRFCTKIKIIQLNITQPTPPTAVNLSTHPRQLFGQSKLMQTNGIRSACRLVGIDIQPTITRFHYNYFSGARYCQHFTACTQRCSCIHNGLCPN